MSARDGSERPIDGAPATIASLRGEPRGLVSSWYARLERERWHRVGADRWQRDGAPPVSTHEAIGRSEREAASRAEIKRIRRERDYHSPEALAKRQRDARLRAEGLDPAALYIPASDLGMKGDKLVAVGGRISPDAGRKDKVASDYTNATKTAERGAPTETQLADVPEADE